VEGKLDGIENKVDGIVEMLSARDGRDAHVDKRLGAVERVDGTRSHFLLISTQGLLGAPPNQLRRRPADRWRWVGGRHFIPGDRDRALYLCPL
jgi:hypothetical protein